MSKPFLVVTALAEAPAGLVFLGAPRAIFQLLLAISAPSAEALLVCRVAGAALLALGLACWLARKDRESYALRGVLFGMLTYNLGVAALLGYAGSLLGLSGPLLWPAVALHTGLSVWGVLCMRGLLAQRE